MTLKGATDLKWSATNYYQPEGRFSRHRLPFVATPNIAKVSAILRFVRKSDMRMRGSGGPIIVPLYYYQPATRNLHEQ